MHHRSHAAPHHLPTHADLTAFFATLLPPAANDVPYLYHSPRSPSYDAAKQVTSNIIFSVTPTNGVYQHIHNEDDEKRLARNSSPVAFLHRPFDLDRKRVNETFHGRRTLLLASHKSFDSALTVGWNTHLAARLSLDVGSALCVQGYKGDKERKIGLIGKIVGGSVRLSRIMERVKAEFAADGDVYEPATPPGTERSEPSISTVAIMNAFHPTEVSRVLAMLSEASPDTPSSEVLYLTGAAREYGLKAASEAGMTAVCVGHKPCEEWGIRFLAEQVGKKWPALRVEQVSEEEEGPTNHVDRREDGDHGM